MCSVKHFTLNCALAPLLTGGDSDLSLHLSHRYEVEDRAESSPLRTRSPAPTDMEYDASESEVEAHNCAAVAASTPFRNRSNTQCSSSQVCVWPLRLAVSGIGGQYVTLVGFYGEAFCGCNNFVFA